MYLSLYFVSDKEFNNDSCLEVTGSSFDFYEIVESVREGFIKFGKFTLLSRHCAELAREF